MKAASTTGWIVAMLGAAFWAYGLIAAGNPPLFDWSAFSPRWISNYLVNIESEVGLLLSIVGMVGFYGGQLLHARRVSQQSTSGPYAPPD